MWFWEDPKNPAMDGWWLGTVLAPMSATKQSSNKELAGRYNRCVVFAWSPPDGHQYITFPKQWCVPAKRSVFCSSITAEPAVEWCSREIERVHALLDLAPAGAAAPEAEEPKGGIKQGEGEKLAGEFVKKHCLRSGWFERCAALIRLVNEGHEDAAHLAAELSRDSGHIQKKLAQSRGCYLVSNL